MYAMFALWVGCAPTSPDDAELGSLSVEWSVGPDGCEAAGLVDVSVVLDDTLMGTTSCSAGQLELQRIEAGSHVMELYGLDVDGVERYAAEPAQVTVAPDDHTDAGAHVLTALPARLDVSWYFDNARLCSSNEVVDVEISVWDDGYLAAEGVASCDDGEATLKGLPSGVYLAEVVALDKQGEVRFAGSSQVEVAKGDVHDIEVMLQPL
jgi:hypothetical protein